MTPQELFELALSYYNGTDNIPQDYLKAYEQFLVAAEAGHVGAQSYLGRMLCMGEGVEQNYDEAVKWLKPAAEAGDADAQNRLGVRYQHGQGVEQNYNIAKEWFLCSATKGYSKAQVNLGLLYEEEEVGEQNYEEAVKWYRLAAEQGNTDAQYLLGCMYSDGKGVAQDYKQSMDWFLKLYESGDIDIANEIGYMYQMGHGVTQDYIEAYKWYLISAENGYADAQRMIGSLYHQGLGVEKDHIKALEWYLKAADNDHSIAIYNVGCLYENAIGIEQNFQTAFQYFMRAANLGLAEAQYVVGLKYYRGEGVEMDLEEAKRWYTIAYENGNIGAATDLGYLEYGEYPEKAFEWSRRAAEQGNSYGQYNLARHYYWGMGVAKDYSEALKWYSKSAENNNPLAYNNIGVMYAEGKGVDIDFCKAREYYTKALEHNGYYAISNIAYLRFSGQGIEKDFHESIRIYRDGIQRYKHLLSLLRLSEIYLLGIGVPSNYKLGVSLLKKIYRNGIDSVCYNLGCAYYHGHGVVQNKETARKLWEKVKDYDNDAANALAAESDYTFRYFNTEISEDSPFYAERSLMFEGNDDRYIRKCIKRAEAGDTDALMNICRTLSRRGRRDFAKEEAYFYRALTAQHPQAIYLDILYRDRKSISSIDFSSPYYIDEIIESQFEIPSDDELTGVVFLIYSIIKGYEMDNIPSEMKTTTLYQTYINLLSDESQKVKLDYIHKLCTCKEKANLKEEFIEYLLEFLEGDSQCTTLHPSRQVLDIIHQQLNESSQQSQFDLFGGAVKYALFNPFIESKLFIKSQRHYNILNLIIDLLNRGNTYLYNQMRPTDTKAQIAIVFPEMRKHNIQHFDVVNEQVNSLNYLLEQCERYKEAILLVDREFCSCVNTDMYEARKRLFVNKYVHKVVELQKGTFHDIDTPTALIFIDFTLPACEVKFISGDSTKYVSYSCLEANEYCLNSKLYNQEQTIKDNYQEYRICDLIEINQSSKFSSENAYCIEDSDYCSSLLYALQSRNLLHQKKNQINSYNGPHILLRYNNGVELYIHKEDTTISCSTASFAIKVDTNKIETDYMAYLLLDKMISEYLSEIVDDEGMFMPRDLLYRTVSIPVDKAIQKQIVEDALVKERQMSGSGVEYNIILLSEQYEHLEKQLKEKGINIFQKLLSVSDGECTFEDLYEQYIEDPSKALIDAIIIDCDIEDYEDVLFYFRTIRERNIQIYLLGDKNEIRIAGSKLREYFLKENRVFDQASDGYLDKLLNKMRDDLDSSNAPQAKIRNKYKAVFEAADALDKKYPDIGISKTVLRYIQTGCNIDDVDNVSGPCGSFRNVCHKLLQVFIGKRLVPDIKPGAIPSLLETGSYYDKKETKKTYVIYKRFMNNYLCKALEYFCKVTNEGVHGSQDSSRLGTAALNILMEFIVWFYENDILNNNLDLLPGQSNWKDITDQIPSHKEKVYTVKSKQVGDKKYFYANNIHISEDKPIKQGMKIKINSYNIEKMGDNEREKIDDEYMVFYASKYDIL